VNRLPLVGKDPAFRAAVALARRVAAGRSPVLIVGPTGSGKSHLARLMHHWGGQPKTVLVEWHGGAVPETLLEAELFGIRSGAATGVEQRAGIFESAGRGTLCLEGVEHLKPHQQAALLRLLEGQPFERIGGGAPMRLEARLIALFQDPPETLIERNLLRADLLYRLDVIRIELPPLSQRGGDILLLADHFLRAACRKARVPVPEISPELVKALGEYAWPGNLRELAQRMEALSLTGKALLIPDQLPPSFWSGPAPLEEGLARRLTLAEMKDAYIRAVLARVGGNRSRAARWLGVSRKALWAHLRRGTK
jgi:two-component system, NtrC family, response regulator HydG